MKYKYYYIISVLMVFIDQYSKNFINDNFILGESFVVNSFFSWTYIQNDGAAFGLLANSGDLERYFLLFVSVFASLFIIFWMHKTNINNRLILFAQSILLAGALGNFIDRMIYGKVTDFIDLHYQDFYWPVFNLADSFIFIGIVLLVFNNKNI